MKFRQPSSDNGAHYSRTTAQVFASLESHDTSQQQQPRAPSSGAFRASHQLRRLRPARSYFVARHSDTRVEYSSTHRSQPHLAQTHNTPLAPSSSRTHRHARSPRTREASSTRASHSIRREGRRNGKREAEGGKQRERGDQRGRRGEQRERREKKREMTAEGGE